MQRGGFEGFVVGEEVADGFVFGMEVAFGDDLTVLFDEDGMEETGCGVGRVGDLAEMGGERGGVSGGRFADGLCAERYG